MTRCNKTALWLLALRQWRVWRRALTLGLSVGVFQALINQGDHWLRREWDGALIAKTVISPLVTFFVALISAAQTVVEEQKAIQ